MKLLRSTIACLVGLALSACNRSGPIAVTGSPSRSLSIALGDELVIQIGGIGPGYDSPAINGTAISYLGESSPTSGIVTPAGAAQLFHFMGIAKGQAVVLFHNQSGSAGVFPDVVDTVVVR